MNYEINEIYNIDCCVALKNIKDKSIDLIVTDCPYRIVKGGCTNIKRKKEVSGIFDKRTWGNEARSGKLFKHNDIDFAKWLPDVYRVLKDNAHCYIMINGRNLSELQQKAEKLGFKFQNLLVWNKGNATPNRYYLNACEFVLMLRKGKAKNINNLGTKNILEIKNIIGNKLHPTEKPVELMKIFIENSSKENDLILDPFLGSGSTAVACMQLHRNYIGFEIDKNYFKIAKDRLIKKE